VNAIFEPVKIFEYLGAVIHYTMKLFAKSDFLWRRRVNGLPWLFRPSLTIGFLYSHSFINADDSRSSLISPALVMVTCSSNRCHYHSYGN
jgi:hypothetical protein